VDLKRALIINETPVDLGSMIPNQIMFELIPDKVVFTGDGPDEMFGGYRRIDQYDSQLSDIFEELPFYHFPRLNKSSEYFNKTLCCPYIDRSIVARALTLPLNERTHKKCLKDAYRGLIPDEIIDRKKLPLKNDELRNDPIKYRLKLVDEFKKIIL
jgi:asparagine synthetase B (glutamine-hydrolysing)